MSPSWVALAGRIVLLGLERPIVIMAALGAWLLARREARQAVALWRERPAASLGAGLVNAYSYVLLLVALRDTEVSVAEPASHLSLLITVGLSGLLFGERIRRRVVPALLILVGLWLVL